MVRDRDQAHRPMGTSLASSESMRIEIVSDDHAPAIARSAARGFCEEVKPAKRATLLLLVSELVTNAVIHSDAPAGAPIVLAIRFLGLHVRVDVVDAGRGFDPVPRDPARRAGGYGLYLVDKVASRWGSDRRSGMRVWFELPR